MLANTLKGSIRINETDRSIEVCNAGNLSLNKLLSALKSILRRILKCVDDYEEAARYTDVYGMLDQKVSEIILGDEAPELSAELSEYCDNRNLNYLRIAIHLMDYNYEFKRLTFLSPKMTFRNSLQVSSYIHKITSLFKEFKIRSHVDDKIESLLKNLNNTLCVILPLGDKLLTIAVHNGMVTSSSTCLDTFMDDYQLFTKLVNRPIHERSINKTAADRWT
jgi:hypothetical protein